MLSYKIDSTGVQKMLTKMRIEVPEKIVEAVDEALYAGISSAKFLAPKDTHKLEDSIWIDEKPKNEGNVVSGSYKALARNKKGHNYGYYQETGWKDRGGTYHEGKYYMERSKNKAEKIFVKKCKEILGGK